MILLALEIAAFLFLGWIVLIPVGLVMAFFGKLPQ